MSIYACVCVYMCVCVCIYICDVCPSRIADHSYMCVHVYIDLATSSTLPPTDTIESPRTGGTSPDVSAVHLTEAPVKVSL